MLLSKGQLLGSVLRFPVDSSRLWDFDDIGREQGLSQPPSPPNIRSVGHRWCTIRLFPLPMTRAIDCTNPSPPSIRPTTIEEEKRHLPSS